jgi:mono/diheme cytochrome c family protein
MQRLWTGIVAVFAAAIGVAVNGQQPKTVWDGVYTSEQAASGAKVYADQCARCHGDGLGGVEAAPPLTGDMFNSNWDGVALSELFERMRSSMPQDKPGSLSRAQNADLLAHMLSVGGFPAGSTAMDGQAAALTQIKFLTFRPQN